MTAAIEDGGAILVALLTALAEALDEVTIAVERRDLGRLTGATVAAEELTAAIRERVRALRPGGPGDLDRRRLRELIDRLAAAARRNAYLIERAWSLDAATMRLLVTLAQGMGDVEGRGLPGYPSSAPGAPAYLDRHA